MKKGYIDTNILIAFASGPVKEPRQYPKAKEIFDDIKQGKFVAVISTLTLTEIKGVFRTHVGFDRNNLETVSYTTRSDYVKSEANSMYNQLLGELLHLPNVKFEKGKQTNFQSILDQADEIMDEIKGEVKFYDTCGRCRASFKSSNHKQILVADILHALLAKDTGCDFLITFDKGFNGLKGSTKINPLEIIVK